jgi:hypothetical protein
MKTATIRPDFYEMWCHSSVSYDRTQQGNDLGCLAEEWRIDGRPLSEAKENFLAHIAEGRIKSRHFPTKRR